MTYSLNSNTQLGQLGSAKFPKLNALKKDPVAKSLIDKLVPEPGTRPGQKKRKSQPPAEGLVRRVSDRTTQNINDTSNIFQLLPDTELAMQILVSSILSPKDMINVELGYKVSNSVMEGEVSGALIEVIREYFEGPYKIKSVLPTILEECLFTKGSYPLLVLPESSLDTVVNSDARVSLESLRGELDSNKRPLRSIGILGASKRRSDPWSMETFTGNTFRVPESECVVTYENEKLQKSIKGEIIVSDNLNALKFPKVIEKMRRDRISDTFGAANLGMEARRSKAKEKERVTDDEFSEKLYPKRDYEKRQYVDIKTAKDTGKENRGHPIVMKLPPEAVIPVHVPSNPEDHIGYFILLDQFGNPLSRAKEADYYRDLSTNLRNGDITSQLMEAGQRAASGNGQSSKDVTETEKVRLYAEIVERDLIARLKNGVYGEGVEISRPLDVYRVMFSRALASMGTQILYVPAELVTYIAFDHNQYGVGKSLLEDNKILASIRSMLLFSNTMAAIKNSTGKTALKIELDPDDPDPSSTVEYMIHEYSRNRQAAYPLGASNPLDIIDFLQNAGIDVQVSGNAAYPETRLDVQDYNSSKVEIDRDLEEDIKARYFMSMGLSPETIDMSRDIEFATSVVTSNLLLAKRVILYQDKLLIQLQDHIAKFVRNSSILWDALMEKLDANKSGLGKENKKLDPEEVVNMFLDSLELTLPRPDSAKLENQLEAFRLYTDALEVAVDAYFGEDSFMLRDFDDVEDTIRAIRSAVIAHYQREWLRNNNVLPELQDLVLQDAEGNPELELSEIHGNHLEMVGKSIATLIEKMRKDRKKREKQLEEKEEEESPSETTGDDTSGDEFGGDDGEGGELDGDEPLDNAPTDDEGGEEEPPADDDGEGEDETPDPDDEEEQT